MDDSQPTGRWPVFNLSGTTMSGSVRADLCLTDAIVTIPSMGVLAQLQARNGDRMLFADRRQCFKEGQPLDLLLPYQNERTASISEKR